MIVAKYDFFLSLHGNRALRKRHSTHSLVLDCSANITGIGWIASAIAATAAASNSVMIAELYDDE